MWCTVRRPWKVQAKGVVVTQASRTVAQWGPTQTRRRFYPLWP